MRYTYLILGCVFTLTAWLIVQRLGYKASRDMYSIATLCYLMMVVFNTYLTSLPIVVYDWKKVLGLKMISWPIEDLAYLVVGLYMAQALYAVWLDYYEKKYKTTRRPLKKKRTSKSRTR